MGHSRAPGPLGRGGWAGGTEDGTKPRHLSPVPGPIGRCDVGQKRGDSVLSVPLPPSDSPPPELRAGARGPDVSRLQQLLNATLHPTPGLVVDGIFGPLTARAARLYQRMLHIAVDGIVGPITWEHLLPRRTRGYGRTESPPKPVARPTAPPRRAPAPKQKEVVENVPELEYELVELVEVVRQDKQKWVKGAAMNNTDASVLPDSVERTDKDGANFKQFINLDRDAEGAEKRHPEFGRSVMFRARVKQKDGKKDKLAGVTVKFKFKRTDGPNRSNPGGSDPEVWSGADLTGDQKEGFGSKNGSAETTANTDDKGWTTAVSFFLSMYGGDRFKLEAELEAGTPGADGASPVSTQSEYVVWRKFWYQMTYADGYVAVTPTQAKSAYAEIFVDMIKANEKTFTKDDFVPDLRDRTFLKEYMLKQGGADKIVGNVGTGNINAFKTDKLKMTTEKEHPLKGNLIICEYQCDAMGPSKDLVYTLTSAGQAITIDPGTGGPIVSKPALKANASLVIKGEWATTKIPWAKRGNIADAHIEIESGRLSTQTVKVNLPGGAPTPTPGNPVYIKLQVETGRSYLGWATDSGVVAVYRPTQAAGKTGSKEDFNDTAAHEFGHRLNQTPRPTQAPASMKKHPLQYRGHGGSGSHCRHGATHSLKAGNQVASQNANTTITIEALAATDKHKVASTAGFIVGHKVMVNGVQKEVKSRVSATELEFTTSFTAAVGHAVVQKLTYGAASWDNRNEKWPRPHAGDCIMYASFSTNCSHKFCKTCKPYLQLQNMTSF